jgi:signal transduction histidine kinase/ActR/RegA family two-component response regulator
MAPLSEAGVIARVLLSFCLLIAAILAVGLMALSRVRLINGAIQHISTSRLLKVELARSALHYSNLNSRITMQIFLLDDPETIKGLLASRASNTATITELHSKLATLADSPEEGRLLGDIREARGPYIKSYLKALSLLLEAGDRKKARQVIIGETLPLIRTYHGAVEGFTEFEAAEMARESSLAGQQASAARTALLVLMWTAVLVAIAIGATSTLMIFTEMKRRRLAEEELRSSHSSLEARVRARTTELASANEALRIEVAERARAEDEVRQGEGDLREAQRVAHVGSWSWTIESDEVIWSDELFQIAGRDRRAKPPGFAMQWQLYTPESWERLREAVERTAKTGEPYEIEIQFARPGGMNPWIVATGEARRDAAGRIVGVRGTAQDVTERRRLEEQLRQSQKMEAIGQLAGGVAHDFNNLLTVISGNCELVLSDSPADDPRRGSLRDIQAAAQRAAGLTRQLLAFSRKQILEPRLVDVHVVIREIETMLRRLIGEDVVLSSELTADPSWVKVDPGQLEQVLLNLAINARDAMPRGGRLTIGTRSVDLAGSDDAGGSADPERGTRVAISISDSGEGMSQEVQGHLFEPFFTTKEVGKGTGLGLATVYGIVKQSGGDVSVESESGRGTTFTIVLPSTQPPAGTLKSLGAHGALPSGTETVLVVEDEEAVRRLVRSVLESTGYKVIDARSGREAVEAVCAHPGQIRIVVTDVVMPDINGREVASRICGIDPGIKVLYMSGYTDDVILRNGIVESGVPFLQKPFSSLALARKVREMLDARSDARG